jgi:hypothetical protein
MRLVVGFFIYLLAVVAVGSGAAAVLSAMKESSAPTAAARPEPTPLASPRIQAWLERRAEGVTLAEKEKTAAQAGRERADALRARLAATPEPLALPRTRDAEERRADHRERAAPAGETAKRQARRRFNEPQRAARPRFNESRSAYGYASEPRWRSYPDQLLTLRDRASP